MGMRRANHASGNGHLLIVVDHLGSTTLVIDTSTNSSPQVAHRQYYTPYGEAIPKIGSTNSYTSIGYTGQRLDGESELVFYNARFYDPVLIYFVSADTIAPDPADSRPGTGTAMNNSSHIPKK